MIAKTKFETIPYQDMPEEVQNKLFPYFEDLSCDRCTYMITDKTDLKEFWEVTDLDWLGEISEPFMIVT